MAQTVPATLGAMTLVTVTPTTSTVPDSRRAPARGRLTVGGAVVVALLTGSCAAGGGTDDAGAESVEVTTSSDEATDEATGDSEAGGVGTPVIADDFPDPDVLEVDGTYYAYATQRPGPNQNIQLATSKDLKTWQTADKDPLPDEPQPPSTTATAAAMAAALAARMPALVTGPF